MIGQIVAGRYAIEELLGAGGMGNVYRAHHLQLDRLAAVKILHPHVAAAPGAAERFAREAVILARLRHPRCVQVYDAGQDRSLLYIAMELIEGTPLDLVLAEEGSIAPARAVKLCAQALEGLGHAHELGIVHRDVKPSNLFLERRGQLDEGLKVVDFGVALFDDGNARITSEGKVMGTPAYMAPEQCQGRDIDGRADLYAMGCALYELIAGRPPFYEGAYAEIMAQQMYVPPQPLSEVARGVAPALDEAVLRALSKPAGERFQTAAAMRAAILAALDAPVAEPKRGVGKKVARTAPAEVAPQPLQPLEPGAPVAILAPPGSDRSVSIALGLGGLEPTPVDAGANLRQFSALVLVPAPPDDGLELARQLCARPDSPPLLLCGPDDDLDRMARAIAAGVYDYVPLPVDAGDLLRKVARARRRRLQ